MSNTGPAYGAEGDTLLFPWLDEPTAPLSWDRIYLNNQLWPGIVEVSGGGVTRKIDIKSPKGEDGASFTDNGYDPAAFDIKLTIYSRADWAQVLQLLPDVHPKRKGGVKSPVLIQHPAPNMLGVWWIFIDKISLPDVNKSTQMLTLSMHALEWMPGPTPVQPGPKGGDTGNADKQKDADGGVTPVPGANGEGVYNDGGVGGGVNPTPQNSIWDLLGL